MNERVYYRLALELESPLSIGAADSVQTDNDVVLDSRGLPLIPATSLAGVYRSYLDEVEALEVFGEVVETERKRILKDVPEDERKRIVGKDGNRCMHSAVRVYDGTWLDGNKTVTTRDNVALKDKVARNKLKFDRQIVERGARFVTFCEITDTERCAPERLEQIFGAMQVGRLTLGSKTTRGFGTVRITSCLKRRFGGDEIDEWLEFDMFDDPERPSWSRAEDIASGLNDARAFDVELVLDLELRGGISIREYSTEPSTGGEAQPDYGQMVVHGMTDANGEDIPVIPGTSWDGAFRERYELFCDGNERLVRGLFGFVDEHGDSSTNVKSRIEFSETTLSQGEWKVVTRNAIDRFTGGTISGALYTERAYFGGEGKLVLRIADAAGLGKEFFEPLVCVLADLHNGMLAVGGLTAVGRGLFRICSANLKVKGEFQNGFYDALFAHESSGFIEGIDDISSVARMFCVGGEVLSC